MTRLEKILEIGKQRSKILFNYEKYLQKILAAIKDTLKKPSVYLVGSVLEDNLVALSDIDIIVECEIPKNHMRRAEIVANIEEKSNLPLYHPFQFHLLSNEELYKWKAIYKINPKKIL